MIKLYRPILLVGYCEISELTLCNYRNLYILFSELKCYCNAKTALN